MSIIERGCAVFLLWLCCSVSWAHQNSTAYLQLTPDGSGYHAIYQLPVRDAAQLIDLDPNQDQQITWQEILSATPQWQRLLTEQLQFSDATQACSLQMMKPVWLHNIDEQVYLYQYFAIKCAQPAQQLNYQILASVDQQHRVLVSNLATQQHQLFAPSTISLGIHSRASMLMSYGLSGVHHLLIGLDHLLFLFCLLLPLVYHARQQTSIRPLLRQTIWVASAFTLAHSITLVLAALQWVSLPSRWVETAIAASVLLAALYHWRPRPLAHQVGLAFGFGLIHGFGFANVLADLPLSTLDRVLALLSFNLGIELGQLLCIVLVIPPLFYLRQTQIFQWVLYRGGLVCAMIIAGLWVVERAAAVKLLPF